MQHGTLAATGLTEHWTAVGACCLGGWQACGVCQRLLWLPCAPHSLQATARLVEYVPGGFGRRAALLHIKANATEDMRVTDSRIAGGCGCSTLSEGASATSTWKLAAVCPQRCLPACDALAPHCSPLVVPLAGVILLQQWLEAWTAASPHSWLCSHTAWTGGLCWTMAGAQRAWLSSGTNTRSKAAAPAASASRRVGGGGRKGAGQTMQHLWPGGVGAAFTG